jgi:hypothetical protein
MRVRSIVIAVAVQLGLGTALNISAAHAQTPASAFRNVALKSGETQELGLIYSVRSDCRSNLVGKPEVEILEGPPDLTVSIKEGDVVPRDRGCRNKVPGGTLLLTAPKEIDDPSFSRLVIRINYNTRDGRRPVSVFYNLSLIP